MQRFNRQIIIFGVGNSKRSIATYIIENHTDILCVVDNDRNKWGTEISGYIVREPSDTTKYLQEENVTVVIATFHYHKEITKQLVDLGWDTQRILVAVNDYSFFRSIEFTAYLQNVNLYDPLPTVLNLELSGYCNCRCSYCPFHGEPNLKDGHKGFMKWGTMDAVIDVIKKIPSITTVDTTGPGEIFLHKQWFEMLEKLLTHTNIRHVIMYTNGMLLTEDNIKKISLLSAEDVHIEISIDGETPKENDEYRIGAQYAVVRENIYEAKQFFERSSQSIDIMITNCYPTTLEEIESSDYKLDSKCNSIPQFLRDDFKGISVASQKTFYYGKGELSKFNIVEIEWPENVGGGCVNLFYRLPISYKGELLRCSCGQAGIEGIGSVFSDDILDLWHNEKVVELARKNFREQNLEEDFCTGCPGKRKGKYSILIRK